MYHICTILLAKSASGSHGSFHLRPGIKTKDPWWVIVLKVIAYIIGLLLGGAVTTSCASYFI